MVDIKSVNLEEEIPYTLSCGETIIIKPVLVKDWRNVEPCIDILRIIKNDIGIEEVITMSYLSYMELICTQGEESKMFSSMLSTVLYYTILGDETLKMGWGKVQGKTVLAITNSENVVLFYITSQEFNDIKKIILYQNFVDYDEDYAKINLAIRKAIEKQRAIESKGITIPTLEKQKIYVMGETGFNKDALNNMTYREFSQLYKLKVSMATYYAKNIIKSGYACTIDGEIKHPLFEKEKTALEEILVDADSFKDKVKEAT